MKGQSTSGTGVQSGLSSQSSFAAETPKSAGMGTKGKAQVPMATPKQSASKGGKKFTIC